MKRIFCLLIILFGLFLSSQVSAQDEKDTPLKGEGISAFLGEIIVQEKIIIKNL